MNAYRNPRPPARLPPRAPWWRMLRASIDGTLSRVIDRQFRHAHGIVRDPIAWRRRFPFSNAEIDAVLPAYLKRPLPGVEPTWYPRSPRPPCDIDA